MYRKILVPMDGSERANYALDQALKLREAFGGELHIITAYSFGSALFVDPSDDSLPVDLRKLKEHQKRHVEEYLRRQIQRIDPERLLQNELFTSAIAADPKEAIVNYAYTHEVDLIVLNSRGESGWTQWLIGSIAEQILRTSPCPVLVVHDTLEVKDN